MPNTTTTQQPLSDRQPQHPENQPGKTRRSQFQTQNSKSLLQKDEREKLNVCSQRNRRRKREKIGRCNESPPSPLQTPTVALPQKTIISMNKRNPPCNFENITNLCTYPNKRTHQRQMFLLRSFVACFFSSFFIFSVLFQSSQQQQQHSNQNKKTFISQVSALDQNEIMVKAIATAGSTASTSQSEKEKKKAQVSSSIFTSSNIRSVVDQILGGNNNGPGFGDLSGDNGDIQSFFKSFENSAKWGHFTKTSSNAVSTSTSTSTSSNYSPDRLPKSFRRGHLYQLSIKNPVLDIGNHIDDSNQWLGLRNNDDVKGLCRTFESRITEKNGEEFFWEYKWCHGESIIQFLKDVAISNSNQDYDGEKQEKNGNENHKESSTHQYNIGNYMGEDQWDIDSYGNGDYCYVQGIAKERSTFVYFECCNEQSKSYHVEDDSQEENKSGEKKDYDTNNIEHSETNDAESDIYIKSVEENKKCVYIIRICRPSICARNEKKKVRDHEDENYHNNNHNNSQPLYQEQNQPQQPLFPPMPSEQIEQNKKLIIKMFTHAYDSYMYNAFPAAELRPLSCKGGTFNLIKLKCLTLIDTLDTLLIFGNYTEFARSVERLRNEDAKVLNGETKKKSNFPGIGYNFTKANNGKKKLGGALFDVNENVSVFETNIRIMGGLLSAHQLALAIMSTGKNENVHVPLNHVFDNDGDVIIGVVPNNTDFQDKSLEFWSYDGFLLELAEDLGKRMLPAFNSNSGIPYGTVNLRHGVPKGETPVASLAGGGTLTLEMEMLSRLTGNPVYGNAAKLATRALWLRRSPITSLLGKHIDINNGKWRETLSGIGSNSDSFYEYLLKHYILYDEEDFWIMFVDIYGAILEHLKTGDWYSDVDMAFPKSKHNVMESLQGFWPGIQIILGELVPAAKTLNSYFLVREELGLLPERFNFEEWKVDTSGERGAGRHPLRPELLESAYMMHRSLHSSSPSSGWQWAMDFTLKTLQQSTWTECGYASVKSVRRWTRGQDLELDDNMPSFFLSETLKYLYLIFDDDNFLHRDDGKDWIFTTEAHPLHFVPERKKNLSPSSQRNGSSKLLSSLLHRRPQKWTSSTTEENFSNEINKVVIEQKEDTDFSLMNLFYGPSPLSNATRSRQIYSMDLPKLHFYPHGREYTIPKSCTNYFHSSLDWMHALNGNAGLEYEESYSSILTNDYAKEPYRPRHTVLNGDDMCALSESGSQKVQKNTNGVSETFEQTDYLGSKRFDMDEMGHFDVTVYNEGFFVQHVETKESIEVTTVMEETSSLPAVFLIRASTKTADRMLIADEDDNVFKCEFVLHVRDKTNGSGSEKKQSETTVEIPCSPAMFGPTNLSELIKSNGMIIEGDIYAPNPSDMKGCEKDLSSQPVNGDGRIQLVLRGSCPFHQKALLQKENYNANGVVVINSEPGHLFVLDSSKMENQEYQEPATVLITHEHGSELLNQIKKYEEERFADFKHLSGSIEMIPHSKSLLKSHSSIWPHVQSSSTTMQILSKSKWGVHAKKVSTQDKKSTWQLYILQHFYDMEDGNS